MCGSRTIAWANLIRTILVFDPLPNIAVKLEIAPFVLANFGYGYRHLSIEARFGTAKGSAV